LWAPRLIRRGTSCARFGSLSEAIIIGGNFEHGLLGRFVVHLIRKNARFYLRASANAQDR
jgi:hypothetical protein